MQFSAGIKNRALVENINKNYRDAGCYPERNLLPSTLDTSLISVALESPRGWKHPDFSRAEVMERASSATMINTRTMLIHADTDVSSTRHTLVTRVTKVSVNIGARPLRIYEHTNARNKLSDTLGDSSRIVAVLMLIVDVDRRRRKRFVSTDPLSRADRFLNIIELIELRRRCFCSCSLSLSSPLAREIHQIWMSESCGVIYYICGTGIQLES